MRFSGLIFSATLTAWLAAPVAGQVVDPGFDGGTAVAVTLTDVSGDPLDQPEAGKPFRITVRLSDPANNRPVTDEHLSGWIRPVEESNGQCRDAARSYFVNQGALPRGSVDLGRSLYGISHEDGTVSIVDWEHSIASANILAMLRPPVPSGPPVPWAESFGFAVAGPNGERSLLPAATGAAVQQLSPVAGNGRVLTAGNGWMARGKHVLPPDDDSAITLLARVISLVTAFPDPDEGRYEGALALTETGMAVIVRAVEGDHLRVQGPPAAVAAGHAGSADAVLFADGSDKLTVIYSETRRVTTQLAAPASRISVSPDQVFALAWSPDSTAVSIVDIATASVVQAIQLNRPPVDQPIREVAFAENAAFLLLRDLDFVMVIDLELAGRGEAAAVRPVRIGPPIADLPNSAGPFLVETTHGYESGTVLALHPGLSSAFPVSRDSGNATAPMNGFRIRGARPLALAELSGALRETAPGEYRAATVLAHGGPHELIVSAGPGRFAACVRLEVRGEVAVGLKLYLLATVSSQDDGVTALDLQLADQAGVAQRWPDEMPVILQSLETGWRDQIVAQPLASGGHRAVTGSLPSGLISVAFDNRLPPGITINPATIEVSR